MCYHMLNENIDFIQRTVEGASCKKSSKSSCSVQITWACNQDVLNSKNIVVPFIASRVILIPLSTRMNWLSENTIT